MDKEVLVRVVRGDPAPEEVVALVAVLAGRSGGRPEPSRFVVSAWASSGRPSAGPRSWRASVLPR